MLASTALVLFMTPGLALFYGGMVRSKSVLNMMMMSLSAMGLIGVLWVLYGYSIAFGNDVGAGLLGNPFEAWGLKGLFVGSYTGDEVSYVLSADIPALVFVAFQATFAIITVALISGAVADRMKFGAWLLFAGLWATIVYFPVAHWVFAFSNDDAGVVGGWIANDLAAIDFAGGTAVHINAGVAALALAIVLGKRKGWPREPMRPHNLTLVMLGAGILWFGWFGFNAGSALGANGTAAFAMVNTIVATCAAMLGWLATERVRDGKATSLGAASGIVAGLVAITPSCASISPMGAILLGAIAGVVCALAVGLKFRFGYDDSLDVVGVHLVGGILGTVLIGFLADPGSPAGVAGLFYGGGVDQLWRQVVGALAVLLYSGILTFVIALIVKAIFGGKIRVSDEDEVTGIDESEHAETAYDFSSHRGLAGVAGTPRPDAATAGAQSVVAGKEG
ncbi:ammonium transporter [Pseudonocardia sp. WMMC193]|uniref:ammonium transporter n=1 Tax=Pseudonocardia sp. WMMC193 TaxID=2911965 RepID=UPI001F27E231|nr:ammonium transporter [Pseudonocardia sp. WMMC193]MCF7550178.1 ammonium transporter [Pseudonocardia sp. WMMC193]